jgi:acetylornithine deacetylase/succinyl-diaminopimelate desuccinylase-like protein
MPLTRPDWDQVRADLVARLQTLVRFDTTNPPGNELPAAEWLADVLAGAGIAPRVLESAPGRASVVARLPGTGELPPLLLMSHIDVVPVEPDRWAHPPFGAEIHDGYIWGRGTLDTKSLTAQHLTLMLLFKALADDGVCLPRDLIFLGAADEEVGGAQGAMWLVDHHPDLLRAEYALNEGGGGTVEIGGRRYLTVQTAEKGLARFTLRARGEVGHASMPRADNAVVRLAEAVASIGRARLPAHLTPTMRAFLETVAATQLPEVAAALRVLATDEGRVDEIIEGLPLDEERKRFLYAATHNTAAPTVLAAGSKVNVFPSEATARVDGRTLPGFTQAMFRAEIDPYIPDDIELAFEDDGPPLEADLASPLYDAIRAAVAVHEPEAILVPMLLTGGTDAKAIVQLGTRVYGFGPMRFEAAVDGLPMVHGHNERISVDNLEFGARVLYDTVARFGGIVDG